MDFNITVPILKAFANKFIKAAENATKKNIKFVASEIYKTDTGGKIISFLYDENENEILPTSGKRSEEQIPISELNRMTDIFRLNGLKKFTFENSQVMNFNFSRNAVHFSIEEIETESIIFENTIKFNN